MAETHKICKKCWCGEEFYTIEEVRTHGMKMGMVPFVGEGGRIRKVHMGEMVTAGMVNEITKRLNRAAGFNGE